MRKSMLAAAALMLATTSSVWAQDNTTEGTPHVKQPDTTAMKIHARDTWEDIKDYSAAQKEQAVAQAKQGLDALDRQIDQVQENINKGWKNMSQEARLKKQSALSNLKDDRKKLQAQYEDMKGASADNWDEAKHRFGSAWESTKQAWRDLTAPNPPEKR